MRSSMKPALYQDFPTHIILIFFYRNAILFMKLTKQASISKFQSDPSSNLSQHFISYFLIVFVASHFTQVL